MSQICVSNLTFAYEGSFENVFENLSVNLDTDWKLGFIGRNGRGKTTFLRLLCGGLSYEGSIVSPVRFDYFPFAVSDMSKTAWEIADSICPDFEDWRLIKELSLLDVDAEALYRPFETLSNGERTKILLAVLFLREGNFLLIDEPTNHLDAAGREVVSRYLNGKKGFILVSHDRAFLDGCIDHVLSLNKTGIEVQKGDFTSWMQNKENRERFELRENERLSADMKRLEESAKRTANWADKVEKTRYGGVGGVTPPDRGFIGAQSARMMRRSKAAQSRKEKAAEEKKLLLNDVEISEPLKLKPLRHFKKTLAEFENVSIFYGEKQAVSNLSFTLENGSRTAICGKNGSGKSSVMKLIFGQPLTFTGKLEIASGLKISYVSQDTSFLKGDLREFSQLKKIDESLFKAILRKLDFSRTQFEKQIEDYSEGQKKKVLLAASLCESAHLYIWDEPLNFVDLLSRLQIQNLISDFCPTLLFVEHDKAFTQAIATDTILL